MRLRPRPRPRMVSIRSFRLAPPPIRFFDLLPTELFRHILDFIETTPRSNTAQRTLHALCLVSKRFKALAQPLLFQQIYPRIAYKAEWLNLLVENNSEETIEAARIAFFDVVEVEEDLVERFAERATQLREVYIAGRCASISPFIGTNLTTISLEHAAFGLIGDHISFMELVNLSFYRCTIYNASGFSLPKLKHLAFISDGPQIWSGELNFLEVVAPTLASFTTKLSKIESIPSAITGSKSISILFKTDPAETPIPTLDSIRNLQFHVVTNSVHATGDYLKRTQEGLVQWTSLITNSKLQLENFSLDLTAGGGGIHKVVRDAAASFAAACFKKGIEILWEERGEAVTFENLVPRWFIEKAEARQV